jgi:hypothetical protein
MVELPRLGAQPVDHRGGELDPVDPETGRGEGEREPAGADRELQRGPAVRQRGQAGDGGLLVTARLVVVGGGDLRAEAVRRVERHYGEGHGPSS